MSSHYVETYNVWPAYDNYSSSYWGGGGGKMVRDRNGMYPFTGYHYIRTSKSGTETDFHINL